jgi:hypothetical protein
MVVGLAEAKIVFFILGLRTLMQYLRLWNDSEVVCRKEACCLTLRSEPRWMPGMPFICTVLFVGCQGRRCPAFLKLSSATIGHHFCLRPPGGWRGMFSSVVQKCAFIVPLVHNGFIRRLCLNNLKYSLIFRNICLYLLNKLVSFHGTRCEYCAI